MSVVQDVLTLEQPQFAARENLTPLAANRQVHLPHVDLRAELVVSVKTILNLRRESDVSGEIHAGFLAACFERREGGQ